MTGHDRGDPRDRSPGEWADAAAEAVRALNHATGPWAGGLVWPADAYTVTANLALLAARLPQALTQVQDFLAREHAAGRIVIVAGAHTGRPDQVVRKATGHLQAARVDFLHAARHLDHAQNALTWAAGTDPDHPDDDPDDPGGCDVNGDGQDPDH